MQVLNSKTNGWMILSFTSLSTASMERSKEALQISLLLFCLKLILQSLIFA